MTTHRIIDTGGDLENSRQQVLQDIIESAGDQAFSELENANSDRNKPRSFGLVKFDLNLKIESGDKDPRLQRLLQKNKDRLSRIAK